MLWACIHRPPAIDWMASSGFGTHRISPLDVDWSKWYYSSGAFAATGGRLPATSNVLRRGAAFGQNVYCPIKYPAVQSRISFVKLLALERQWWVYRERTTCNHRAFISFDVNWYSWAAYSSDVTSATHNEVITIFPMIGDVTWQSFISGMIHWIIKVWVLWWWLRFAMMKLPYKHFWIMERIRMLKCQPSVAIQAAQQFTRRPSIGPPLRSLHVVATIRHCGFFLNVVRKSRVAHDWARKNARSHRCRLQAEPDALKTCRYCSHTERLRSSPPNKVRCHFRGKLSKAATVPFQLLPLTGSD